MATIIQGEKRVAFGHYGFYQTHAGGDLPVIVRRTIGDPTCWMHENSRPVMLQRERFKRAVQHYARLTPPQKWLSKRRLGDVEYIDNHGVTQVKLLSGRQLVISEDIHALATTGRFTEQPFQVCIILCKPDYEPLLGELYLEYQDEAGWHEVEGRELNMGNWLFVEVPGKMTAYRVWGEAVGWQDPMLPENQNMSEAQLKAKHWHKMEVPPVTMEFRYRFYSDPYPILPAVDGRVGRSGTLWKKPWDDIRNGAGTVGDHVGGTVYAGFTSARDVDTYFGLWRSIHLFDTSRIPASAEILEATLRIYGYSMRNGWPDWECKLAVCRALTAENDEIVPADYGRFTTDVLCEDPLPFANFIVDGWNTFHFNERGLSFIQKGSVTKLGIREYEYDLHGVEPEWSKTKMVRCTWLPAETGYPLAPCLDVKWEIPEGD